LGKVNRPTAPSAALQAPTPLTASHLTDGFDCGHPSLNAWVQKRALANAASGASRTYVVCADDQRVIGYYALAAGSIAASATPGALRRNMPDPLPVIVLGRLAVDNTHTCQGVGQGLLKDAVLRSLQAAQLIGARALLCHAIDNTAKAFYLKHGFVESPSEPLTVFLSLRTAP
jgi:predicted N-acetyltransferase YhbS